MEPQTQLILALIITMILTSLLVWGANWIKRNRVKHPEIYESRGVIGALIYIILNIGDF
jgi:hypothetical protein